MDGYRLAMSTDPAVNVEKPFYIPPEVMAELTMFKDQDCTISVGEEWAAVESETLRVLTRIPGYDGFDVERAIPHRSVRNIPLMWISFWMKSGISTALSPQKPESRSGLTGHTLS